MIAENIFLLEVYQKMMKNMVFVFIIVLSIVNSFAQEELYTNPIYSTNQSL